jgi:nucleotide-binding universal stress UspA family protein
VADFCSPGDEVILLSIGLPVQQIQRGTRPGRVVRGGETGPAGGGAVVTSRPDIPVYAETKDQAIQRQLDEMQDYLLDKAGPLEKAGFRVESHIEVNDNPAEAILDLARRSNPAFVMLARSTHHSVGQRIFGTVAQHVIRENVVPVLVLPVPEDA